MGLAGSGYSSERDIYTEKSVCSVAGLHYGSETGHKWNIKNEIDKAMFNFFKSDKSEWQEYAKSFKSTSQFKNRTDRFWAWFMDNEAEISRFVTNRTEYDTDDIISFIDEGTKLISDVSDVVPFNIGGDYEFTFVVEDNSHLFYLYPYLISRMPDRLADKWKFYPCQQGSDTPYDFSMYGARVDMADVRVSAVYRKETNDFVLSYYEKSLCSLTEDEASNMFYLMMYNMIGEDFSYMYVADAVRAGSMADGMMALPALKGYMKEKLEANGKCEIGSPHTMYDAYSMDNHGGNDLRDDVIGGSTCFDELIMQYYDGDTELYDNLDELGARAVFLYFAFDSSSEDALYEAMKVRGSISERLIDDVLRPDGSGLLLGGATGAGHCYIDLLLYDGGEFLKKAVPLLNEYPQYSFYLSEFRKDGKRIRLTGK